MISFSPHRNWFKINVSIFIPVFSMKCEITSYELRKEGMKEQQAQRDSQQGG
jgi:hypothetical protein